MSRGKDTRRAMNARQKRAAALEIRLAGGTYQQIVEAGLYASRGAAHKAVNTALADVTRPAAEEYRRLQSERTERLIRAAWPQAMNGDLEAIRTVNSLHPGLDRYVGFDAQREADADETAEVQSLLTQLIAEHQ